MSDFYDDETLVKVYDAMIHVAGITPRQTEMAVTAMLNAGILFRERETHADRVTAWKKSATDGSME